MPNLYAPITEEARLADLEAFEILDTPSEEDFDNLVEFAAISFNVPIVAISLLDETRQWFKAVYGLGIRYTMREDSFCTLGILGGVPLIIPDALLDFRTVNNPFVVSEPHIRFYAGFPLLTRAGQPVGTFCILDTKPREMTAADLRLLEKFARQTISLLEARKHLNVLTKHIRTVQRLHAGTCAC